jgi:hypothetical protein
VPRRTGASSATGAMIRFLFRFLGLWFLAAGFIFLIYDGMKSIADQTIYITRTGDVWIAVNQASYQNLGPTLAKYGVAWLWDPALLRVLEQPTWLVLGVVGIVLILLGRRKKALIGYTR